MTVTLDKPSGISEDLGGLLGFDATTRLIAIFGGQKIYVPKAPAEHHPIARVIGLRKMQILCNEFGGEMLRVIENDEYKSLRVMRSVAKLIEDKYTADAIAQICGITKRQVYRYRSQAEELGLLQMVFKPPGAE